MSRIARIALPAAAALAAVALAGCGQKTEAPKPAAAPAATQAPAAAMPGSATVAGEITPDNPHPAPNVAFAAADLSGIRKAEGGQTVAELFEKKDQLAGKPVVVRGKIVKTNANIMGRTWVHLRDGSGAEGTNDVTVTTNGPVPAIGDTALVKGTLGVGKDFGMGYQYPVIVEDATITKE